MKVIIAGDRDIDENDMKLIEDAVFHSKFDITEVVSGKAKGGDHLGEKWAKKNKVGIKFFEAKWKDLDAPGALIKENKFGQYNARAGFDRNQLMAEYAEGLIALQPNGRTDGTSDMIKRAHNEGLQVFTYPLDVVPEYDLGISEGNEFSYVF